MLRQLLPPTPPPDCVLLPPNPPTHVCVLLPPPHPCVCVCVCVVTEMARLLRVNVVSYDYT